VSRVRLASSHIAAAIAGAVLGAVLVLAVDGMTRTPVPRTSPTQAEIEVVPSVKEASSRVLLAWSPFEIPSTLGASLERMPSVVHATTVHAGLEWIVSARSLDGTELDRVPKGYAIPWELAVIEPHDYSLFVPASERERVASLRPGEVLLARTEAALRAAEVGAEIRLRDGLRYEVAGIVSDEATQGYEGLVAAPVPDEWMHADRFVLATLRKGSTRARVEQRIHALAGPAHNTRVRAEGETPYLRYGDAVQPQMFIKESFGEFAARPLKDGSIEIDEKWRDANLATERVPLLGQATCHVALFPMLRATMREVIDSGLAFTINREQFAGCYSPRFVDRVPWGRLSHHSWGIAVDLNAAENATGTRPDQDRRLVEIMESYGFTWGGRWIRPDGMHFEWVRFP
jgi:hypothetical protein